MGALLGIDIGTGSVKALVMDERGRTLGRGSAEHALRHPQPGWAEQDPDEWWRGTVGAVRAAMAEAGAVDIAAIGLSGQMHGTVLLDADRTPIRPAIIWADTRSAADVAALTARSGQERLIEIAGSPLATGFQAATLAWLHAHEPEAWRRVRTVLLPKDEIRRRMTGELMSEPSDASSTLLLDVRRRDWSDDLLAAVGIDRSFVPPLVASTAVSGALRKGAADALGLRPGIPVAGGGADAPLAVLAAGVVRPEQLALTISTGAQVIAPTSEPRPDPAGRIHAWCACLPPESGAGWYQMGATMVAGLALRWLRDEVFALDGENAYARMTGWAENTPAGAAGLVFLPYLAGERTPHMNSHARGVFLGLTAEHGRGHLVRAVMEGATLALFDAFEVLRSLGASPREIVLSGGGAQSRLWRQIVADVFGLLVRPLRTVEQSALGAALLAGAAIGQHDLVTTATAWATYDEPVMPDLGKHAVYGELLAIFRNAYRVHIEDFERLNAMPHMDPRQ
jgi:xylulokinase